MEHLPNVTFLSPRVIRILGFNPGPMTLQGTNTYLIGTGKSRILIDTSEPNLPEYRIFLKEFLESKNIVLEKIIITHDHHGHIGSIPELCQELDPTPDVYKFINANSRENNTTEEIKSAHHQYTEKHHQSHLKNDNSFQKNSIISDQCDKQLVINNVPININSAQRSDTDFSVPFRPLLDDEIISVEGATLKILHTPGHTYDHLCVYLPEERALFSGDLILGHGITIYSDVPQFVASLEKVRNLRASVIYPGHGAQINNVNWKIESHLRYIEMKNREIMQVLRQKEYCTPAEITAKVFGKLETLKEFYAQQSVISHLNALNASDYTKKRLKDDCQYYQEWEYALK